MGGEPAAHRHRGDVEGDADQRQGEGVDLWVAERPGELLPDGLLGPEAHGGATPEVDVGENGVGGQHRQRQQPEGARHQQRPTEQRDATQREAGDAAADDGGEQRDRGSEQAADDHQESDERECDGLALTTGTRGAEPAVDQEAGNRRAGTDQPGPEGKGGHPWEGDAVGPDLEGGDCGAEAHEDGHDGEQHEPDPVGGPELEDLVGAAEHLGTTEVEAFEGDQDAGYEAGQQGQRAGADPVAAECVGIGGGDDALECGCVVGLQGGVGHRPRSWIVLRVRAAPSPTHPSGPGPREARRIDGDPAALPAR